MNQHGPLSTFIPACFPGTVAPAADSAAVIDAPGELLKISSLHGRKTCREGDTGGEATAAPKIRGSEKSCSPLKISKWPEISEIGVSEYPILSPVGLPHLPKSPHLGSLGRLNQIV